MNITYTWAVTAFERLKENGSLTNVITRILGDLIAHDLNSGLTSRQPFAVKLDSDNIETESFVSFNNIDEKLVMSWIVNTWGEERIAQEKELLANEIQRQLNFEIVPPPW